MPERIKPTVRELFLPCADSAGTHRLAYSDRGPEDGRPILCAHYLTGNGHFFDTLAEDLARHGFRVVAPDMPGRGRSDNLQNPDDYCAAQYLRDISALLAHLGWDRPGGVDWIGASMGGVLGMGMAALPVTPVRRAVLLDIGPAVPAADIDVIAAFVAKPAVFQSLEGITAFMREMRGPAWGAVPEGYWERMARYSTRRLADGTYTFAYDTRIAKVFAREGRESFWHWWDAMTCPVLSLRGATSTIFPAATAQEMLTRGPGAQGLMRLETLEACGHIPSMTTAEQLALVREWLGRKPAFY